MRIIVLIRCVAYHKKLLLFFFFFNSVFTTVTIYSRIPMAIGTYIMWQGHLWKAYKGQKSRELSEL